MLNKLNNIITGWKNYVFESKEIESMAKARAVECAKCENAEWGYFPSLVEDRIKDVRGLSCTLCSCPLSGLLRSPESKCKIEKWQAR